MTVRLRFSCRQWLRAFKNLRFRCQRGGFAAEDDAVWFLRERFDEFLGVSRDHFQVQKSNMQLFQLFLKLFVRRADELVGRSQDRARSFLEAIKVCDYVLYIVRVHL